MPVMASHYPPNSDPINQATDPRDHGYPSGMAGVLNGWRFRHWAHADHFVSAGMRAIAAANSIGATKRAQS